MRGTFSVTLLDYCRVKDYGQSLLTEFGWSTVEFFLESAVESTLVVESALHEYGVNLGIGLPEKACSLFKTDVVDICIEVLAGEFLELA